MLRIGTHPDTGSLVNLASECDAAKECTNASTHSTFDATADLLRGGKWARKSGCEYEAASAKKLVK